MLCEPIDQSIWASRNGILPGDYRHRLGNGESDLACQVQKKENVGNNGHSELYRIDDSQPAGSLIWT